jgi:hypothetical protein
MKTDKNLEDSKRIKIIFYKLIDQNFFENYKIPKFFHNYEITNLGKPTKNDWISKYNGYKLVIGRCGNGDTIISFKLRPTKLLIFRWDTDDTITEGKRYLGSINIQNPRKLKLEKIITKIKENENN